MNKKYKTITKNFLNFFVELFKIMTIKTWWIAGFSSIIPIFYTIKQLAYGGVIKFENYAIYAFTLLSAYSFLALAFTFLTFLLERDIFREINKNDFDSKYWARKLEMLR